jgi:hypothetical protein
LNRHLWSNHPVYAKSMDQLWAAKPHVIHELPGIQPLSRHKERAVKPPPTQHSTSSMRLTTSSLSQHQIALNKSCKPQHAFESSQRQIAGVINKAHESKQYSPLPNVSIWSPARPDKKRSKRGIFSGLKLARYAISPRRRVLPVPSSSLNTAPAPGTAVQPVKWSALPILVRK